MRKLTVLLAMVALFAGCATKPCCDDMDMGAKHRHMNMKKEGGCK